MNALALQVRGPQFERGSNALARGLTIGAALDEGEQRRVQTEKARADMARTTQLQQLKTPQEMRAAGFHTEANAIEKGQLEITDKQGAIEERNFKVAKDRYEATNQALGGLYADPNLSKGTAMHSLERLVGMGVLPETQAVRLARDMPDDPVQLKGFLRNVVTGGIKPEKMLEIFAPKATEVNDGATKSFRDTNPHSPTYGQMTAGGAVTLQQSPDNKATNARIAADSAASRAQSDRHHQATLSKPFEVTGPEGTPVLVQQTGKGGLVRVPGFQPKAGAGAKMTEDQAKATGWLVQADNAWKNMQDAGMNGDGSIRAAAKPGINDALEMTPIVGGLANKFRTADRQKFIQASKSLSEALLRAATGAGVNKDEAVQKVREVTPIYGEDDDVTQQKFAAIPRFIESLKVRAGPGAAKATAIAVGASTTPRNNADLFNQADAILNGGSGGNR